MKTYKTISAPITQVHSITCNKCGDSCIGKHLGNNTALSVEYYTNYDNDILPDVTKYEFDICEKCLDEFMKSFKIPVEESEGRY